MKVVVAPVFVVVTFTVITGVAVSAFVPRIHQVRDKTTKFVLHDTQKSVYSNKKIEKSKALPFLDTPLPLVDLTLAGNFGFDPLGLAGSKESVLLFREAEIKHARLAMLASVGWPLSELFDQQIASKMGWPDALREGGRVPSVLNGGLLDGTINPIWWGLCLGLTAAIDLYGVNRSRSTQPEYDFPGNLGFDPLNLYPRDETGRQRMQLAEIKHGRLSMMAVTGFAVQEALTGTGVVKETPVFFFPVTTWL